MKRKLCASIVICDIERNVSFVRLPFPFQLCRTILVPDDRTQKVEYLEIGVYRTTPLMPDRGLVGDNRSSKVFEFATFSSPTQSRRFFFSLQPRRRRIKFVRVISLYSHDFPSSLSSLSYYCDFTLSLFLSLFFFLPFFSRESVSSFTSMLHAVCSRKYKIYGSRYCEICGRCGARPKAGRFQVEIAFWRLIDSWLLESEWYYYDARCGTR